MIRPALLALLLAAAPAAAQEGSALESLSDEMTGDAPADPAAMGAAVRQLSAHEGEMVMDLELVMRAAPNPVPDAAPEAMRESLRFEPFQIVDEIFDDDLVFVMRAGPTDWSRPDAEGAEAGNCAAQRVLSPLGRDQMRTMGILMAGNGLRPGRVLRSEWCRARSTAEMLVEGFGLIDPAHAETLPVERLAAANPLERDPAADVAALRAALMAWDGPEAGDAEGPLLVVTHFDTIEALTRFRVYEGEILIFDPDREGRVLGYIRLRSAAPDPGRYGVAATEEE